MMSSPSGDHVPPKLLPPGNFALRLSASADFEFRPVWSPSGEEIVFASNHPGDYDIFLRRADASDEPNLLVGEEARDVACDWSVDGKYILYRRQQLEGGGDLWYLERGEDGTQWTPRPFLETPDADDRRAKFSPNGRFVAYESDASGKVEIYVRSFPDGEMQGRISTEGGIAPRWRADGRELFYVEGDALVAAPVSTEGEFFSGTPRRLFRSAGPAMSPGGREYPYAVSRDGKRFVVSEQVGQAPEPKIHVVLNWYEEFRDRQPK